jgi:tetratricopeptide (TPR) repeat protein
VTLTLSNANVKAALTALESDEASLPEKIQMLVEMAAGLQKKPKSPEQLEDAVVLYRRGLELCPPDYPLLLARCWSGMGTALRTLPSDGAELLLEAKAAYETALPILEDYASPEEIAEVQMNLGGVLQGLVPFRAATISEAIQAYQKALTVFTGENYPQEFAIIQNNMAISYLSTHAASEGLEIRQAMAIQALTSALQWVTLFKQPREYAMLQNNLANVLQYLPSTHPVDNNLKAIAAYDEALKVRTAQETPLEYAATISNKANALSNLPDDLEHPEKGNYYNLLQAKTYYQEADQLFRQYQQFEQADIVGEALQTLEQELASHFSDQ